MQQMVADLLPDQCIERVRPNMVRTAGRLPRRQSDSSRRGACAAVAYRQRNGISDRIGRSARDAGVTNGPRANCAG